MAKKKQNSDCMKWHALGVLVLGFWFLLVDLGYISGYGINWWTVIFLLVGCHKVYKYWFK